MDALPWVRRTRSISAATRRSASSQDTATKGSAPRRSVDVAGPCSR